MMMITRGSHYVKCRENTIFLNGLFPFLEIKVPSLMSAKKSKALNKELESVSIDDSHVVPIAVLK